ncbi:hypothetical protein OsI_14942 [Oryza sativa Indica Group]|uniref:Uncharacterized protein n=1 Tax=Oryza sativa subsp. indica TaxID=39946 RepID=A2XQM6_ORYSI|nr:hypothetical protein OsI_14942 [Oryza sativa Indica Group]
MAKPLRSTVLVCASAAMAPTSAPRLPTSAPPISPASSRKPKPNRARAGTLCRSSSRAERHRGGRTSTRWAAVAAEGGGEAMRRWVDRRLRDSFPVDTVEEMTTLALQCVAKDAAAQPEMSWPRGSPPRSVTSGRTLNGSERRSRGRLDFLLAQTNVRVEVEERRREESGSAQLWAKE